MSRRAQSTTVRAATVAAMLVCAGCGGKTGLDVGDAAPRPDSGTPADAGRPPRCVEVPRAGGEVTVALTLPVSLAVADVFFLIDATGSMSDEIDNVRAGLRSVVVPGVRAAIPDPAFGLGFLGEFPERPYGPPDIKPYELRSPITRDVVRIEGGLDRVPSWGNADDPEAQVEALYQVATGDGLLPWIPATSGCAGGGSGGACFREDALPVVVLITDAPMHDGPDGADPYRLTPPPHAWPETREALRSRGILVIGLGATDAGERSPLPQLEAVSRETGAVDARGEPLVFDIGASGDRVGAGIVDAIERLAAGVPLDVDAVVVDMPGDGVDALTVVRAIRPRSADPPGGVRAIEADRFVGVTPGTRVVFELVLDAAGLPPSAATRRFAARVLFRADGRSRLGSEDVVIVVPGTDSGGCEGMEGA